MGGLIYLDYQPSQMVIGAVLATALALLILGGIAVRRSASAWLQDRRMRLTVWRWKRRTSEMGRAWVNDKEVTGLWSVAFPALTRGRGRA